jgi:hypothetical protein
VKSGEERAESVEESGEKRVEKSGEEMEGRE